MDHFEEIKNLISRHPSDQDVPFMGPPVLRDLESGRNLSQMPAIVLYVSRELDLMPEDPFDVAICMKVLMDCNDVLMEICRFNGSTMWEREAWKEFRSQRFPRWLQIFEESLQRGLAAAQASGEFALSDGIRRCAEVGAVEAVRVLEPKLWIDIDTPQDLETATAERAEVLHEIATFAELN